LLGRGSDRVEAFADRQKDWVDVEAPDIVTRLEQVTDRL
jgi:hypothetical protein